MVAQCSGISFTPAFFGPFCDDRPKPSIFRLESARRRRQPCRRCLHPNAMPSSVWSGHLHFGLVAMQIRLLVAARTKTTLSAALPQADQRRSLGRVFSSALVRPRKRSCRSQRFSGGSKIDAGTQESGPRKPEGVFQRSLGPASGSDRRRNPPERSGEGL